MGLFNFFTTSYEEKQKKVDPNKESAFKTTQLPKGDPKFTPTCFDDLKSFINYMKIGRTIIVDCSQLKEITALRVLDILSGAAYALSGDWTVISPEVFMFVPNGSAENGKF